MMHKKSEKKAVFFTLSMFFLVTAILALAIVAFHYTSQERIERTVEISSLNRLYDLSSSVEYCLLKIFNLYSDMTAIIVENPDNTTNVSITETISKDKEDWGNKFEEEVENFEIFVESRDENVKLDIEIIENKELPLVILPHNITYTRNWDSVAGKVFLSVVPETLNFNSYDISIHTGAQEVDSVLVEGTGSPGDFYVGTEVKDDFGYSFSEGYYIDLEIEQPRYFKLTVAFGGHEAHVTIDRDNDSLEIWTDSDTPITIKTTIDNLEKSDEKVRAGYLKGAINITLPNLGVSRIGSIAI